MIAMWACESTERYDFAVEEWPKYSSSGQSRYTDIFRALKNFKQSQSTYLLPTTYLDRKVNSDVETGGWRPLNFQHPPFCFPAPLRLINEKCKGNGGRYSDKCLGLCPAGYDSGPVLVAVEYEVPSENVHEFLKAVRHYGRIRRRDGASRWGIFHDLEHAGRYVETFIVSSWAEHLRQHERMTRADRELEERLQRYSRGSPRVRHLVSVATDE